MQRVVGYLGGWVQRVKYSEVGWTGLELHAVACR